MQIFSSLRRSSSPRASLTDVPISKGFTLIELLISLAIITIITSLVLVRFTAFDSTILLKNLAYEIAGSIREAQIYSVSVINTGASGTTTFRYPYGISFTRDASSYTFFRFNNASPAEFPNFDDEDDVTVLRTLLMSNSMKISDLCLVRSAATTCGISVNRVDISFRRPEFTALFYDQASGNDPTIQAVKICVQSIRNPVNTWVVEVKLLGQITVYKSPSTECNP